MIFKSRSFAVVIVLFYFIFSLIVLNMITKNLRQLITQVFFLANTMYFTSTIFFVSNETFT